MLISSQHVGRAVLAVGVVVLLGTVLLIVIAILRRKHREKYFQAIDRVRDRCAPVITGLLAGELDYETGLSALRDRCGAGQLPFLEETLFAGKIPMPSQVPVLRRLAEDLGLVELWQQRLTGQFKRRPLREALSRPGSMLNLERFAPLRFLLRANSAENLEIVRHRRSWPLLLEALNDPHPDVRGVAMRTLAALGEPQTFPALIQRLQEAVLNPSGAFSVRPVKSALILFPLPLSIELLPSLRHSHSRIRYLATDIIREMVERQAALEDKFVLKPAIFSPALADVFLSELVFDENPDVRARAGPVIAYLDDARAMPALLALLDDPKWFVRLHAVRALGRRPVPSLAAPIGCLLTDLNWRVREAAVGTLMALGDAGVDKLLDHFLATEDRYSREQIAEALQRAGLFRDLLVRSVNAQDGRETRVVEQLARMGKTSYLVAALVNTPDASLRTKFLQNFGKSSNPQLQAVVRGLPSEKERPLGAAPNP